MENGFAVNGQSFQDHTQIIPFRPYFKNSVTGSGRKHEDLLLSKKVLNFLSACLNTSKFYVILPLIYPALIIPYITSTNRKKTGLMTMAMSIGEEENKVILLFK